MDEVCVEVDALEKSFNCSCITKCAVYGRSNITDIGDIWCFDNVLICNIYYHRRYFKIDTNWQYFCNCAIDSNIQTTIFFIVFLIFGAQLYEQSPH